MTRTLLATNHYQSLIIELMSTGIALDLRAARRKAGYTQDDIAHLLDHHQSHVSDLEQGHERPKLEEIVALSLIYGRSFEILFDDLMEESREALLPRVETLPVGRTVSVATFNRSRSLKKLRRRLTHEYGDRA